MTAQSLTELEANKQLVSRLFEVIYGTGDNLQILDEVVAEDDVQHNPLAGEGREGLRQFFQRLVPLPDWLDSRGTVVVNLIAEGEFVVRQEIRTPRTAPQRLPRARRAAPRTLGRLPSRPWHRADPRILS